MLSILIPTYNYDIRDLVNRLHEQLQKIQVEFEIICLDDGSHEAIRTINKNIDDLPFTSYHLSTANNGIALTRQLLCEQAKYDWMILLDADTVPKDDKFISNYMEVIRSGYDFIFGGFAYENLKPHKDYLLRWKYGKRYEALNASKRNANSYKITIAANVLAKKKVYMSFNMDALGKQYAMDYYFGALLKQNNSTVLHLDNEVYHLGIEKSSKYLRKKEQATETLLKLYQANKIDVHANDLLRIYLILKRYKLNYVMALVFKIIESPIKWNLLGKYPIVLLLQFYKVLYMCHFELVHKDHGID